VLNFIILKCSATSITFGRPRLGGFHSIFTSHRSQEQSWTSVLEHDLGCCSPAEDVWRMCSKGSPGDGQVLWHRRVTSEILARGCQEGRAEDLDLKFKD
jgi:hypothetical protein